MSDWHTR